MHTTSVGFSGFFDDEEAARHQRAVPEVFRAPDWMQAPDDELPARLPLDVVISRTEIAVIVLREVAVFSAGFEVNIDWYLRRRTDDPWEWQRLTESAFAGSRGRFGSSEGAGLRFGVALADGAKVPAAEVTLAMPGATTPEPPTAMTRNGGGGGGESSYSGSSGLWVWMPEPTRGKLAFVTEWADAGVPITTSELDGDAIAEARSRVSPMWATG